jgi:hypothetical protein
MIIILDCQAHISQAQNTRNRASLWCWFCCVGCSHVGGPDDVWLVVSSGFHCQWYLPPHISKIALEHINQMLTSEVFGWDMLGHWFSRQ